MLIFFAQGLAPAQGANKKEDRPSVSADLSQMNGVLHHAARVRVQDVPASHAPQRRTLSLEALDGAFGEPKKDTKSPYAQKGIFPSSKWRIVPLEGMDEGFEQQNKHAKSSYAKKGTFACNQSAPGTFSSLFVPLMDSTDFLPGWGLS